MAIHGFNSCCDECQHRPNSWLLKKLFLGLVPFFLNHSAGPSLSVPVNKHLLHRSEHICKPLSLLLWVLGIEPRALHILNRYSTTNPSTLLEFEAVLRS